MQCCSTIYLILFEGYNLTLSRIISGNNKALFKKYRMWRRHIKYCQPKETPKNHIE